MIAMKNQRKGDRGQGMPSDVIASDSKENGRIIQMVGGNWVEVS
jgi:hypothetical protein